MSKLPEFVTKQAFSMFRHRIGLAKTRCPPRCTATQRHRLPAAFASQLASVHHTGTRCHFRTAQILPPRTDRTLRQENPLQTSFPGDTQREIARLAIAEELARLRERRFDLAVSDEAFEFLVRRRIQRALGARSLKKIVWKFIGDAVRDAIKSSAPSSGVLAISLLNDGSFGDFRGIFPGADGEQPARVGAVGVRVEHRGRCRSESTRIVSRQT